MTQMKEQIKTPEKELSDEEIANLSDAEFKNTGNQDAHRKGWAQLQIDEEMKVIQSKINENTQGTNNEGKETRTQINGLEQKEEINIQPGQNEEIIIQKLRRDWVTLGTTLNITTSEW